ncbi:MAG: hypothetical protein OEY01_03245 [Desulfobulbaceae bacterium]|nr:hypothetical protein [Desulfobulbaceae bacterium]HIJ78307.1 hypothetical protein [Deltaproteobacteria bacterium]
MVIPSPSRFSDFIVEGLYFYNAFMLFASSHPGSLIEKGRAAKLFPGWFIFNPPLRPSIEGVKVMPGNGSNLFKKIS